MKYDSATKLGLSWAGYTSVRDSYTWDPGRQVAGVGTRDVLGVEADVSGRPKHLYGIYQKMEKQSI